MRKQARRSGPLSSWPIVIAPPLLALALLACSLPGSARPATPTTPATALPATPIPLTPTRTPPNPPSPTPTRAPSATWQPPQHLIGVRTGAGEFFDRRTGAAFVPRGVNYVYVPDGAGGATTQLLKVGVYNAARTRADFQHLAGLGYNTVRVFLDHCNAGPGCIGSPSNAGLNPAYLDNIADLLAAAREAGLFILFTSNDLPDQGGYAEEANSQAGDTFAGYRNSYYLTAPAVRATRRYWGDLLSGLRARQAAFDYVLGWQLLNEQWMFADQPPLSLTSGLVQTTTGEFDMADARQKRQMVSDGLIYYIAQMREEILAHDPTALVTMGFFAPEIAAPGWFVDTAPLLAGAALDFFDFHAYPGGPSLAEHVLHFGMQDYQARPILMGEYGAFRSRYDTPASAARALLAWVEASCGLGFDGWLYWTYSPAGAGVGDATWGFTDEDGYLMDLLAPANQPDACQPVEVPNANLAYGRPVIASNALPEGRPELAVDENDETQWNAGSSAPQWIEVDLQGAYRLTEVRLRVAQYPDGDTHHQLLVPAPGSSGYTVVHEFTGPTRDGEWLVFTASPPLEGVERVRVYTVSSPSWVAWKEIQILGE
jgi:hypothetical protein